MHRRAKILPRSAFHRARSFWKGPRRTFCAKVQYRRFLPECRRLLRVGGVLCADDVSLFADGVPPKRRMLARHISEFLADLQADPAFTTQILPVGKGLAVAVKGES